MPKSAASKLSEGARLLAEALDARHGEGAELAAACGVEPMMVSRWKCGRAFPSAAARDLMRERYNIPAETWPPPKTAQPRRLPKPKADPARVCPPGTRRGIDIGRADIFREVEKLTHHYAKRHAPDLDADDLFGEVAAAILVKNASESSAFDPGRSSFSHYVYLVCASKAGHAREKGDARRLVLPGDDAIPDMATPEEVAAAPVGAPSAQSVSTLVAYLAALAAEATAAAKQIRAPHGMEPEGKEADAMWCEGVAFGLKSAVESLTSSFIDPPAPAEDVEPADDLAELLQPPEDVEPLWSIALQERQRQHAATERKRQRVAAAEAYQGPRLLTTALASRRRGEAAGLAAACGVDPSSVSDWRSGRTPPPREVRAILLERYGIPVDAFPQRTIAQRGAEHRPALPAPRTEEPALDRVQLAEDEAAGEELAVADLEVAEERPAVQLQAAALEVEPPPVEAVPGAAATPPEDPAVARVKASLRASLARWEARAASLPDEAPAEAEEPPATPPHGQRVNAPAEDRPRRMLRPRAALYAPVDVSPSRLLHPAFATPRETTTRRYLTIPASFLANIGAPPVP
jgi:transcriptional regulator with XRE-family HTH domain